MFVDHARFGTLAAMVLICSAVGMAAAPGGSVDRRPQPGVWVDTHDIVIRQSTYVASARVEPLCIRAGHEYFRIMIGVVDPQIISVRMDNLGALTYRDTPVESIDLYDDGTHGDELVGDGVFTIDEISLSQTSSVIGRSLLRFTDMSFGYADSHEETSNEDLALTLHYITDSVTVPTVTVHAADVRASRYAASIVAQPSGAFPDRSVDNGVVAGRYYDYFADDRDFLLIAKPFNTGGAPAASFGSVRNDIEGIGLPQFDDSSFFGSAGVLQGVMNVYWGNVALGTLNHELLHRWAAFLDPSLDLARAGGHWGAIEAAVSAFGGPPPYAGSYDNIEFVSGDTYRAWNNAGAVYRHNQLELYLMGLIAIAEVPTPIAALVNPVFQTYQYGDGVKYSIYTADAIRQVSTADILAVEGSRVPDHAQSQRLFRTALIVAYDRPLTDVELAYYDHAMREYQRPLDSPLGLTFAEATGGRAAVSTSLPRRIPTVSQWGVMVMFLALLVIGTAVVIQRSPRSASRQRVRQY